MNFDQHRYLSLKTFRKSGNAVMTPVWFAADEQNRYYVFSEAKAGKVKRLRNSSRIELTSCDIRGGSLGEWIPGEGHLVNEPAEVAGAYRLLRAKYGLLMSLTNFFSWLTGRIHNRQVIRLEVSA